MARHGGKQGGRPKGRKNDATIAETIEKEVLREKLRAKVAKALDPMTDAQIDNATGIKHLMLRDPKTGKFERVKDEAGIDTALKSEGEAMWIYTKDPSTQAFTDLMNRTLDKPAETVNATVTVEASELLARLDAGRQRAAGRKR